MNYHVFTVECIMRDCKDLQDAKSQLMNLLPQYPDDDSSHNMESWVIIDGTDLQTKERWSNEE